jgi:hypothetical protein
MNCPVIPKPYACLQTDCAACTGGAPLAQALEFTGTARYIRENMPQKAGTVAFKHNPAFGNEEYILRASDSHILIEASDEAGAFYAAITLKQLLAAAKGYCRHSDTRQAPLRAPGVDD